MSKDNGGPAFPAPAGCGQDTGMTLRDYFAAKAMQSLILAAAGGSVIHTPDTVSGSAYEVADAMLARKEK